MFCYKCGAKINDNAMTCEHCGCETRNKELLQFNENKLGVGVLCAFLLGIMGLLIGAALYPQNTKARETFILGWKKMFLISILFWALIIMIIVINMIL